MLDPDAARTSLARNELECSIRHALDGPCPAAHDPERVGAGGTGWGGADGCAVCTARLRTGRLFPWWRVCVVGAHAQLPWLLGAATAHTVDGETRGNSDSLPSVCLLVHRR